MPPETADFESEFLKLLTDALHAGPGTPAWHDAVGRLRQQGGAEADEYQLLLRARENLESGQDYRSVRAGAGFTRKVLAAVDGEAGGQGPGVSTPAWIAVISGLVIVGIVVGLGAFLLRSGSGDQTPASLHGVIANNYLPPADFTRDIPADWQSIGKLPLKCTPTGLRIAPGKETTHTTDYRGGGVVSATGIPAEQVFLADVLVRISDRPSDNLLVALFVTDSADFDDNAESGNHHELVVWVQGGQVKVGLPDGSVPAAGDKPHDSKEPTTLHLIVRMDKQFAIVESEGKTLFSGKHQLSPDKLRRVGVRFKYSGGDKTDAVAVQSVRIQKP